MTSIRKWFINFNDNLTDLTFHSSSNFHYQIVSAQSIQKIKLCLTSLMSMKSALSLSSQNIILIGFIYIYHHLFTICTICRTKLSWKINIFPRKKNLSSNSKRMKIYVQQKYIKNYHHF